MTDISFREALSVASPDDYVDLFTEVFAGTSKFSLPYVKWQYLDNPLGAVVGMDAYDGGRLVAHYSAIPVSYVVNGRAIKGILSVNTATRPEYRGIGLFPKLAQATYDLARQKGMEFVLGAANANSVSGFVRKLGFQHQGQIRLYIGRVPSPEPEQAAFQDWTPEWLKWRLANPSSHYWFDRDRDGVVASVQLRGVYFNLGRLSGRQVGSLPPDARGRGVMARMLPSLTPYFGSVEPRALAVPQRIQPSPWHIVYQPLSSSCDPDLIRTLEMRGLSMDTF